MSENVSIRPRFESIGFYVPEKVVTTEELVSQMESKPMFDLERITKIKERRFRSESESSYSMALAAAKDCLKNIKHQNLMLLFLLLYHITKNIHYGWLNQR